MALASEINVIRALDEKDPSYLPSGCTVKYSITKEKACRKRVTGKGEAVFGISGKKESLQVENRSLESWEIRIKHTAGTFSSAERMYVNSDYIESVLNNGGIPMQFRQLP